MGLLTPTSDEADLMRRMFEERVKTVGIEAYYYEVKDLNLDELSRYDRMEHFHPIKIDILFEEMPNPKTLRSLNWWDDSEDTVPPIAHIPWHVGPDSSYELKPVVGAFLEIMDPISKGSRFFEIQEINANSLYLINSIVKLSPARFPKDHRIDNLEDKKAKPEGNTEYEYLNP